MMALKFFYDVGEINAGQGDDAAAIRAIDYAIQNGARVISASWGGYQSRDEAEKSELKQALIRARDAGVLFVVAAGNGHPVTGEPVDLDNTNTPCYPAAYDLDNVLTVAAIDKLDQIAEFSNYGAKSVHIGAPGVRILSTTAGKNPYSDLVAKFTDPKGNLREAEWSGTSMATPIVAGAAALILQHRPELTYKEVRELILSTARKIPALEGKVSTGGTLDVEAALGAAATPARIP
jgi:subtilisin family serine protease